MKKLARIELKKTPTSKPKPETKPKVIDKCGQQHGNLVVSSPQEASAKEICDDLFDVPILFKKIVEMGLAGGENEAEESLIAFFKATTQLPNAWGPTTEAKFGSDGYSEAVKEQAPRASRKYVTQILKQRILPRPLFRDWLAWRKNRLGETTLVSLSDPAPSTKRPPETMTDKIKRLDRQWFWLLDSKTLQEFESDPYAQGYEVLRRDPARALKPGDHMPALGKDSKVFRGPWPKLTEWEREYIRSVWSHELALFGLIVEPPIVSTKAIYFRCDQAPDFLYHAAESAIESAIRMREEEEARQAKMTQPEIGPISYHEANEAASRKRIDEMPKDTEKPVQAMKPADPSIVFGSAVGLYVPTHRRRPGSNGRQPSTPSQFKWEAQTPEDDPAAVVLYLPTMPAAAHIDDQNPSTPLTAFLEKKGLADKSRKERPMYADEILAYFRTFLTTQKEFKQHRRRVQLQKRPLRRTEPRSITLGLVAFDFRQAAPKAEFKALARDLFAKRGKLLGVTQRQVWSGLSNGFAAISRLHSRLNSQTPALP